MRLQFILLLIVALGLSAAEPKPKFRVTCTECQSVITLPAAKCLPSGGRTVEGGVIQECTLYFKCPVCKKRFTARHEEFKKAAPKAEKVSTPKPKAISTGIPLPPAPKQSSAPPPNPLPAIWQKQN